MIASGVSCFHGRNCYLYLKRCLGVIITIEGSSRMSQETLDHTDLPHQPSVTMDSEVKLHATTAVKPTTQSIYPAGLSRYKNLHRWMIIPMVIMQLGIFIDYWGDFSENAWSVHIHYWTGSIWYAYLILQPYYATHGQMKRHRTNGIIGMFLAGGVALTALSMMHRDMVAAELAVEFVDRFGPFRPWFFYGVAATEIVMMTAFMYAVVKSIVHRKETENHAWWLISTVFLIMMPALGRGIQNAWIMVTGFSPETDIMTPIYLTIVIIIALTLWAARRYGRINHPATYLAVGVNLFIFLLEPLGRSGFVQGFLKAVIKG